MKVGWLYHPRFLDHAEPGHPERPERLEAILLSIEAAGIATRLTPITPAPVDPALLAKVHDPAMIAAVRALCESGGGYLDPDTYANPDSFEIARLAAGAAARAVDAILDGEMTRAFIPTRPPGHHASRHRSMGFCLFNNVAIAAAHALERDLPRVLIVDWDVHHGNGTQEIFYADGRVLYFSTHQHPHYPGTGAATETGIGSGAGTTVNVPLPPGTGDGGLSLAFERVLTPVALRFRPSLVLLSAGFDAHYRDPLASLVVSTRGFRTLAAHLVRLSESLCGGRIVVCLEGGYDLGAVAASSVATLAELLGLRGFPDPHETVPRETADVGQLIEWIREINRI